MATPSLKREQLIAAAASAIATKEHPRPATNPPLAQPPSGQQTPMGATAPARTGGAMGKAASAAELRASTAANLSSTREQPATGWGTEGATLRHEPGSNGGHVAYSRRKVVHSVGFGVMSGSELVRPPPTASARLGAAPKSPGRKGKADKGGTKRVEGEGSKRAEILTLPAGDS